MRQSPEPGPGAIEGESLSLRRSEFNVPVYELLDAHDDTARLASKLDGTDVWRTHLDYLRRLQRIGREALA